MTEKSLEDVVTAFLSRCRWVDGCLVSPRKGDQYGLVNYRRKPMPAHRAVYEVKVGPIPDGMVVRHRCDNKPCVNVDHLEIGTQSQNRRDMFDRDRQHDAWRRGDGHPQATMTSAVVSEMRLRVAAGETLWEVASEFGLNYLTVCSAVRGRSWKHVETPPVPGFPRRPNQRSLKVSRKDDCLKAAQLANDGLTTEAIGQAMGVSRMTAWNLAKSGRELLAEVSDPRWSQYRKETA